MNYSQLSIDSHKRASIERDRLVRILGARTRLPTTKELEQYDEIVTRLRPRNKESGRFLGMQAVTLTREGDIDLAGYGSLKADGLHAHLAHLPRAEPDEKEHFDTALLITRDEQVYAVDGVQMHAGAYGVLLDGEICLRKNTLALHEMQRLKRACNVHSEQYIEYPSDADADADDVCGEAHQRRYDEHWDLVFAAFDCMYVVDTQLARPYSERIKLAFELLETPTMVGKSVRYSRRAQRIQEFMQRAAEHQMDKPPLTVFVKPTWRVLDFEAALHAPPHCLHGVPIDGVVFTPNDDAYTVGVHKRVLKWKPQHTLDVKIGRENCLFVQKNGRLHAIDDELLTDTEHSQKLAREARDARLVVECVAVLFESERCVCWRPVLLREEKRMPNSYDNFAGVRRAVLDNLTEERLKEWLSGKIGASGAAMGEGL